MNRVILIGRITKDCEVKYFNDSKYLRNSIAVQRDVKNKNGVYEVDFFNFIVWGNTAEYLQKYCKKGDMISIDGKLQNNSFEKDGQRITTNEIYALEIKILTRHHKQETPEETSKINDNNAIEFLD